MGDWDTTKVDVIDDACYAFCLMLFRVVFLHNFPFLCSYVFSCMYRVEILSCIFSPVLSIPLDFEAFLQGQDSGLDGLIRHASQVERVVAMREEKTKSWRLFRHVCSMMAEMSSRHDVAWSDVIYCGAWVSSVEHGVPALIYETTHHEIHGC